MENEQNTLIDFIAEGPSPGQWRMVLVEEGPWDTPIEAGLLRLQERLYGCIDAALDGKLAKKFPDTIGKEIAIQVDCYNLPEIKVLRFFECFTEGVFNIPDYRDALKTSIHVKEITFCITFDNIH